MFIKLRHAESVDVISLVIVFMNLLVFKIPHFGLNVTLLFDYFF